MLVYGGGMRIVAPSRWPPRVALILGLLCFTGALAVAAPLAQATRDRQNVEEVLARADAQDAAVYRQLADSVRGLRGAEATWRRRRVGLALAGLVLVVGGFWAMGLRRLHDKMVWAVIETETGDKPVEVEKSQPG